MTSRVVLVRLTPQEAAYLLELQLVPESDRGKFLPISAQPGRPFEVALDRQVTELIGLRLTARLAQVGFDAQYRPLSEGKLLEDLIDRFGDSDLDS